MTITAKDIGKQCFVRFKYAGKDHYTWENVGARIAAIHKGKITVKVPNGERFTVPEDEVRVLEPRPA